MATDFDARRKQIAEAAEGYTAGAWRSSWPLIVLTMSLSAWLGALSAVALAVFRATRQGALPHPTGVIAVSGVVLLEVAGAAGIIVLFLRWQVRWRAAHTEVVPVTSGEHYPWLRGVVGVALLPLWLFLFGRLFREASVALQPLLWAVFIAAIIGLDMVTDLIRRATPAWRRCPTGLIVIGAYIVYAIAVALGAPQPWAHAAGAVGFLLRIGVPQLVVAALVIALGELHSRHQFRRLQRLVNESAPPQEGE